MSDLPDFYQGTSPGFGMSRTGQVLTRVAWTGNIAAGANQVNTTALVLPGYVFTIDTIHLFSTRVATAWLNNAPFRYVLELNLSSGVPIWDRYFVGLIEGSKTLRLFHATGAGIRDVYGFRETIYNDTRTIRTYTSIIYYLYNEA